MLGRGEIEADELLWRPLKGDAERRRERESERRRILCRHVGSSE